MSKVKIGKKEYELESLSSFDLKKLEAEREKKKLNDYDYAYTFMLHAVNKFNNLNLTLDEFMELFPIKDADKKFDEIGEIIGVDFTMGSGKSPDGKTQ